MTPNQEQLRKRAEDNRIRFAQDLLFSYCDSDIATASVVQMHKNNASVKDYILALHDGLRYGNWPWIEPTNKFTGSTRHLLNMPQHKPKCPAYVGNDFPCDCDGL